MNFIRSIPHLSQKRLLNSTSVPRIFDQNTKATQKARAALLENASSFDYLRDEVATLLVDRLADISRPLPHALDLCCGSGAHFLRALQAAHNPPNITHLTHADLHNAILQRASTFYDGTIANTSRQFIFNENNPLPIPPHSLDLVVSGGALHWVNDLPGVLIRAKNLLKPDGLLLAAMFGGETLQELRISMQLAEDEIRGGISPHVSPMVRLRDVGSVLSRAGLVLTTADVDRIVVPFTDMSALMRHLRGMGETNAMHGRQVHFGRKVFERAAEIYKDRFGFVDSLGRECIPATFEIMHMIGWAPSDKQPQPAARGSAQFSISDLAKASESVNTNVDENTKN